MEALIIKNRILDYEPEQSSVYLEQDIDKNTADIWSSLNQFHLRNFWQNSLLIEADNILPKISINAVRQVMKIKSFSNLQPSWDSYGAEVPSGISMNNSINFIYQLDDQELQPFFVAPGNNGEVLVEYKKENRAAEIYFNPDGTNELLLFENNNLIIESTVDKGYKDLLELMK